jgi:hypothetical protein
MKKQTFFLFSFLLFSPLLNAATYVVPTDAELVRSADSIAMVTIESSHSYLDEQGRILTDHICRIERSIKGSEPGRTIVITEAGGSVGNWARAVSSSPVFTPGERALVFLERLAANRFRTLSGELGKFSFVLDSESRQLLVRGASEGEIFGWNVAGERHMERSRRADAFVRYLERLVEGIEPGVDYLVPDETPLVRLGSDSHVAMGGNDYLSLFTIVGSTRGGRWPGGSRQMRSIGTQTGVSDLAGSIGTANGAWNSTPDATIGLSYGGVGPAEVTAATHYGQSQPDMVSYMFFNQPNSGPLAGSVVGQAEIWVSSATVQNGADTYFTAVDCDIVIEAGFTGTQFQEILAHEKGHCLGFRHSNQPSGGQVSSSNSALMFSSVSRGGAILGDWDREAAAHVYGSGAAPCTPPSISSHPQSISIVSGNSTNLSVTASGTGPFTYQWYRGNSGVTTNPVGGGTSQILQIAPTATTSYWVRVTDSCGTSINSSPATVTVCVPPSISSHPQSQSIVQGGSVVLGVSASGSSLIYQWFAGSSGTISNPVPGGSNSSILVAPATTTSYWVRVSGACGAPADSAAATVTVSACTAPAIVSLTPSQSVVAGATINLSVVASGTATLQYNWFQGEIDDSSKPIGATAAVSRKIEKSSKFWVRVINGCGEIRSSVIEVQATPSRVRGVRR